MQVLQLPIMSPMEFILYIGVLIAIMFPIAYMILTGKLDFGRSKVPITVINFNGSEIGCIRQASIIKEKKGNKVKFKDPPKEDVPLTNYKTQIIPLRVGSSSKIKSFFITFKDIPVTLKRLGDMKIDIPKDKATEYDKDTIVFDPSINAGDIRSISESQTRRDVLTPDKSRTDILFYGIIFLALGIFIGLFAAPYLPLPTTQGITTVITQPPVTIPGVS